MPIPITGPVSININPNSRLVYVWAAVQTSTPQSVTIADSTGKAVFQASGASSTEGAFTMIGSGSFQSSGSGTYTVTLTLDAGILVGESVIASALPVSPTQDIPYLHSYTLITNDGGATGGDKDFNDLTVSITVYNRQG